VAIKPFGQVFIEVDPLTGLGKIDRKALRAPYWQRRSRSVAWNCRRFSTGLGGNNSVTLTEWSQVLRDGF
jgi:hypothetical protein